MYASAQWRVVLVWIPAVGFVVGRDDDLRVVDRDHAAFALDVEGIHIQNTEELSEGHLTSEFVQYDRGLLNVAIPPALVPELDWERYSKGLLGERGSGLPGAGGPDVDDNSEAGTNLGWLAKGTKESAAGGEFDEGFGALGLSGSQPTFRQSSHEVGEVSTTALMTLRLLVVDELSFFPAVLLGVLMADSTVDAHFDVCTGQKQGHTSQTHCLVELDEALVVGGSGVAGLAADDEVEHGWVPTEHIELKGVFVGRIVYRENVYT